MSGLREAAANPPDEETTSSPAENEDAVDGLRVEKHLVFVVLRGERLKAEGEAIICGLNASLTTE